tara:strand:- start:1149 stop:2327 length:1179 start_codon:yes stop_codon:yes gene_type:complete
MQEIMTDFWLPFCRKMVDAILSSGIVAIRIVELDDGLRVPVVLEANSCQIKMKYELGIREYICLDQQRDEIPNTLVLDSFGFSPNIAGKLTSIIANLLPQIQYINTLRGTCLAMEQKRTSPIVMTETVDTKVDNVEGVNYDYYADGDMQDNSDQNKFMRNRSSVQQLAEQQQMYDSFFSEGHMASKGSSALENVVTLPLGHKIVNMPQQTGRGDLCAQMKAHDDLICAVMGIPRSLVMSDTPHKTDAEGTHQTFQKTIMFWKNSIQTACEQIYNVIYADKIKEQMMKVIGKKRKKSTVEDVYALKKRMQVEISFPISPFIGADQLYIHYQRGTITWERYQEHACAAAALPHEPLPEPTDPEPSDVTVSKEKPEKEKPEKKKKIEDSDSEEEE